VVHVDGAAAESDRGGAADQGLDDLMHGLMPEGMEDRGDEVGSRRGVDLLRQGDIDVGSADRLGAENVQAARAGHAVAAADQ